MKTKLLIIVMSILLLVNSYDLRVFANTDYDHDALLEYEGYGQAIYETVVEETTFISGKYTDNKEYVSNTIDQIKDYASGWWNEYSEISNLPPKEKVRAMIEASGGYLLTVGDWVKKLFNGYTDKVSPETPVVDGDFSHMSTYFTNPLEYNGGLSVRSSYRVVFTEPDGTKRYSTKFSMAKSPVNAKKPDGTYYKSTIVVYYSNLHIYYGYDSTTIPNMIANMPTGTISDNYKRFLVAGIPMHIETVSDGQIVDRPPMTRPDKNIETINNFFNDGGQLPPMKMPKPKAYLSCPDGTRINMVINGGTFLDVKGNVMQVNTDGTASVDGSMCNLGWEKPKLQYSGDSVVMLDPDGKSYDVETGEHVPLPDDPFGEIDEELPDDCGMVCAIGKFMGGLGTIAKNIAMLPLKILDGLLELVKKILIPEENFWTTNLDSLKNKFFHDELKEVQNGVEGLENVGGGQFGDVTGSLMGVDNLTIIDSSSINMSLEKIHSWVRGFFYPLLLFFNINQMYRVIRGTSLIGIGGKKEE